MQEAFERIVMSFVYLSRLTPQTNMGASADGAELFPLVNSRRSKKRKRT